MDEIEIFLRRHLQGIIENDVASYHETTLPDLTLYEWWVTPYRIDGLPFHEFMMTANAEKAKTRFDLSNLRIQRYGDAAIASYTLLVSASTADGVKVAAHNETRVIVKVDGAWKVAHVHKSPAYQAPHVGQ
jgi:hypothetical protein